VQDPQRIAFIAGADGAARCAVLLQSSDASNWQLAERLGVSFLHKHSPTLLEDVRSFMLTHFGFGDFVFRSRGRRVRGRATCGMVQVLREVRPSRSSTRAAQHFSNWFGRTEFALARGCGARVSEFSDLEALRRYLIRSWRGPAAEPPRRGEDFSRERSTRLRVRADRRRRLGGKAAGWRSSTPAGGRRLDASSPTCRWPSRARS